MGIDYEGLILKVMDNIKTHSSSEKKEGRQVDKILVGFLNLLDKLLKVRSDIIVKYNGFGDFMNFLFDSCLFLSEPFEFLKKYFNIDQFNNILEFKAPDYVKCKTSESRKAAYRILI